MIIKLYQQHLYLVAKDLLGFKDVNKSTHLQIIDALQKPTRRKLICVPRGTLKSSIACVAYPIWLLINNPNLRILIDSELYTNSKTFLREIKLHLEDPHFELIFGKWKSEPWNDGEIIIRARTAKLKEPSISCGGVQTTKVGQHFDIIIMDDLNSTDNSNSPEACQKVIDHYKLNISILEPTGTMVLIGTRYNELDCIGYMIANELGLDHMPKTGEYDVV
jgi:hypothetical protein